MVDADNGFPVRTLRSAIRWFLKERACSMWKALKSRCRACTSKPSIARGARMFEVRIHGRGGQGVVTAAEMLSVAAFLEGKQAQAFPSFGSARTGAPVVAFCRIADKEIRLREPIQTPTRSSSRTRRCSWRST
jgi:hypothetical protein